MLNAGRDLTFLVISYTANIALVLLALALTKRAGHGAHRSVDLHISIPIHQAGPKLATASRPKITTECHQSYAASMMLIPAKLDTDRLSTSSKVAPPPPPFSRTGQPLPASCQASHCLDPGSLTGLEVIASQALP